MEAGDLNPAKDVYISFETDNKFQITAGPKDMVLIQLFEFQTVVNNINFMDKTSGYMSKYIFLPQYTDYKGIERENEYILTTLEINATAAKLLEDNNVDLVAYIGNQANPQTYGYQEMISMVSGIAYDVDGLIDSRKFVISTTPSSQEVYITVKCVGQNCGTVNASSLQYGIKVNSISMAETHHAFDRYEINMHDNGGWEAFFFQLRDEEAATVKISLPDIADDGAFFQNINCSTIPLAIYACIGTQPGYKEMATVSSIEDCMNLNVSNTTANGYVVFDLDSSSFKVSAGTVFFVMVPDMTKVVGNISMASNCAARVDLYINEQIGHFNQVYTSTLYAGTGH